MKIITPLEITDSLIVSSNIVEDDEPVWSSVTSYSDGARVIYNHKIYESLVNSNTNNVPSTSPTQWLEISATNKFKAFDTKVNDKVVNAGSITYTISHNSTNINGIAIFNPAGATVRVQINDPIDGLVYDQTQNIVDGSGISSWADYFFAPTGKLKFELLFLELPYYPNASTTITVTSVSGNAELGQIVMGTIIELGLTVYNTTVSIEDYSRKERDVFGNAIIIERPFADLVEFDCKINTNDVRFVQKTLSDFRATPIVYIGTTETSIGTVLYGYYRRFDIVISGPSLSEATIEVEGLV